MTWSPLSIPALARDGIALVIVALALMVELWASPITYNAPFILIYPVVFLIAWFLGRRAAVIATLMGAAGAVYWLITPLNTFYIESSAARGRIVTFILISMAVTQILHLSRQYYIKLKLSDERYHFATTVAKIGTWEWDLANDTMYGSSTLKKLFDLVDGDSVLSPECVFARIHPEDQEFVRRRIREAIQNHELYQVEFRIITEEGLTRWLLGKGQCVYDGNGRPLHLIGTNIDTTDLKNAEKAVRESASQYRALAGAVPVGIFRTDTSGACIYANERWSEISGLAREHFLGHGWMRTIHPDDINYVTELWKTTTSRGLKFDAEYRMTRPSGAVTWVSTQAVPELNEAGLVCGYVGAVTDVTERKNYEESLRLQATTDELTGLANRAAAMERLDMELDHARDENRRVALMFIDLDNFKHVNDTLGHQLGDQLLVETAQRLTDVMGTTGTVARFAGDEFLVAMPRVRTLSQIEETAQCVLDSFARVFHIPGNGDAFVTCSIGIAVFPEDGDGVETLLRHADIALYRAKETGRNNYQFFLESMNVQLHERRRMELNLRYAMDRNELSVFYQPVMLCGSGSLAGFEALLRWNSAEIGQISPEKFIPLAEETGLIEKIGAWVLEVACKQLKEWQIQTQQPLTLAVNVSSVQIHAGELADAVSRALASSGLSPDCLELELTERSIIPDNGRTEYSLQHLHEKGVRLSVDDFGTGYSNLGYFQRLPLHSLKLDKSFLVNVPSNTNNTVLARTIIAMSHNLGLAVIAEGIENDAQWQFLRGEQCNFAQGFFFSEPMPASAVDTWLAQRQHQ